MNNIEGIKREIALIDRELVRLNSKREMLLWELGFRASERPIDCHKPLNSFAAMV